VGAHILRFLPVEVVVAVVPVALEVMLPQVLVVMEELEL
jgi:hypothetical protein